MTNPHFSLTLEVLLIEDDPDDTTLTLEAFADSNVACKLTCVGNGEEALALLNDCSTLPDLRLPNLILLDLAIPGCDGFEVLRRIKTDPRLQSVPVVVVTGSSSNADIERAYRLQANCVLIKPNDLPGYAYLVREIERYWLGAVALPEPGEPASRARHSVR